MSVQTVVSIIMESPIVPGAPAVTNTVARLMSISELENAALAAERERDIVRWIDMLRKYRLQFAKEPGGNSWFEWFFSRNKDVAEAIARLNAEEAMLNAGARAAAPLSSTVGVVASVILPIVGMVAVQVALGAGYYQAREQARAEGYAWGFAKGFITGLLHWDLRFAIDRFWDNAAGKNAFDENMITVRANANNKGLVEGRIAALAKTDREKKEYLRGLHRLTTASKAGWTSRSDDWMEQMRARQVQMSYVTEFATAARKHGIVSQD